MNLDIREFMNTLENKCKSGDVSGDMLTTAKTVACAVKGFLTTQSVGTAKEDIGSSFKINSGFDEAAFAGIGVDNIIALVKDAGIRPEFQAAAAGSIAAMLYRASTSNGDFTSTFSQQTKRAAGNGVQSIMGYEDLMPQSVHQYFSNVSTEAFGANSDKVVSDLQVAMTVSLLKWHNTLTPRVLSNIPTTEPVVNYVREEIKVYELGSSVDQDKSVLDMYEDPSIVSNELTRIIPLYGNKVAGEVVADGILAFGKEANLIALGKDANKLGHTTFNRTDIVADGIKLDYVRVSITLADGITKKSFDISIPESRGRLTRAANQLSTARTANITHTVVMDATYPAVTGTAAETIGAILLATGDKLVVKLEVTPRVDIRNGNTYTLGAVSWGAVSSANGTADDATRALVTSSTIALLGYSLDARYSEENNRKSNIATTTERTQLVYEIPQGRNFVLDVPLNGPVVNASQNHANLYNVVRIGQDNVTLQTILGVLAAVGVATDAYAASPIPANKPGDRFAAGGRVKPTYVAATLDMIGIDSFDDSRRQDAIQGRVLTFLNAIVQTILSDSKYTQQLDGNSVATFRLITSPVILGNIVGAKPGEYLIPSANGVELTLKLASGVILECVTTTFDYMAGKIVLIPFLSGNPASELNFGHNRDYGTVVGSYTHSDSGSAVQRLIANVRELPVPTNAIGAIIDVTNIDKAVYRA